MIKLWLTIILVTYKLWLLLDNKLQSYIDWLEKLLKKYLHINNFNYKENSVFYIFIKYSIKLDKNENYF
jgi:hypothetical protein